MGPRPHSDSLFCILLPSQVTHYRILCGLIGKMETSVQRRGGEKKPSALMGTISTHSKCEGTSSSMKKQETYATRMQAMLKGLRYVF